MLATEVENMDNAQRFTAYFLVPENTFS